MRILHWAALQSGLVLMAAAHAQAPSPSPQATQDGMYFPSAVTQTETDEYTRYELLAPETGSFKIFSRKLSYSSRASSCGV